MKIGLQLTQNPDKYHRLLADVRSQIVSVNDTHFIHIRDEKDLLKNLPELEVLLCYRFQKANFSNVTSSLKWIQFGAAGIEHSLFPELLESNIQITNARGIHVGPVSEFVLAAILYFAKRFQDFQKYKADRQWRQWEIARHMVQLSGKTAGIIGYGSIGKAVAKRLDALGMKIIAIQRQPTTPDILPPSALHQLLSESDFVVVNCPLTEETKGMIDNDALNNMKSGTYIINVSRGAVIDEKALIQSLKSKGIAGAALDVFSTEPLPANSPLFELDNVLLSPHVSGNFPEYQHEVAIQFGRNLNRYLNGLPLTNLIDKQSGY